jgi:hypothetical protein
MHPHGQFSSLKRLEPIAKKGLQNLCAHQSSLQQSLNDLPQGLKPTKVRLSHIVPPDGLGDNAATREHGKSHIGVVPQKEPCFPPPDRRVEHQEVKVGINSRLELNKDVHTAQHHLFRVRAML